MCDHFKAVKEHLMRITIKDCDVSTFRAGGPGGQNQNKRETAVRIVHRASGAVGESREHREQLQNKKAAFRRMAESPVFKQWVARLTAPDDIPESRSTAYVRTYNLVNKRVKDHRTGDQTANVMAVLDGELDTLYGN